LIVKKNFKNKFMTLREKQFNFPLAIPKIGTPKVETNRKGTPKWTEAHRQTQYLKEKKILSQKVRQEIIDYYNVEPSHVIFVPSSYDNVEQREMRAFSMLINKKTGIKYYADGHMSHADLLNIILTKFYSDIHITDRRNLPDNFTDEWEIKKGFFDPYVNGFAKFQNIHETLKEIIIENQGSNNKDIVKNIQNNTKVKLPNWFISGSEDRMYKNLKGIKEDVCNENK